MWCVEWCISPSNDSSNPADAIRSIGHKAPWKELATKVFQKSPSCYLKCRESPFLWAQHEGSLLSHQVHLPFLQWVQENAWGFKLQPPLPSSWDITKVFLVNLFQNISFSATMPGVLPGHPAGLQHPGRGLKNTSVILQQPEKYKSYCLGHLVKLCLIEMLLRNHTNTTIVPVMMLHEAYQVWWTPRAMPPKLFAKLSCTSIRTTCWSTSLTYTTMGWESTYPTNSKENE